MNSLGVASDIVWKIIVIVVIIASGIVIIVFNVKLFGPLVNTICPSINAAIGNFGVDLKIVQVPFGQYATKFCYGIFQGFK